MKPHISVHVMYTIGILTLLAMLAVSVLNKPTVAESINGPVKLLSTGPGWKLYQYRSSGTYPVLDTFIVFDNGAAVRVTP